MAQENIYENIVALNAVASGVASAPARALQEKALFPETPLQPSSRKTTFSIPVALASLALLLAIALIAVAILYFQKERKLVELGEVVEKIRTSLQLSNVSYGSKETLEDVDFLENISEAFSELQARLENASVSRTAIQDRYRNLLDLVSAGWMLHDGYIYLFSQEIKSWRDAEDNCRLHGAHLTSITSQREMQFLLREAREHIFWIGLTDQQEEGNWTWVDGTKYNKEVSFWKRGQPDNWHKAPGQREDCVHVGREWNDASCTNRYKAFCKKVFP